MISSMDDVPRYCAACGGPLQQQRRSSAPSRFVCSACQRITYRNPVVGVAVVIAEKDRLLLGRRARGPYAGRWCIPCGYVEWDEDVRAAARREMHEETGLEVEIGEVCAVHSNFHDRARQTVGIWFWGAVCGGALQPTDDLDALAYYPFGAHPRLAFPTDELVLASLCNQRRRG
jgi:ADP-ribose pyrophosphatase YjhB (NUDIX family)